MSELEYFSSVENIEISLYAQARQSLLLLTQGNKQISYVLRGIKRAISRKLVKISDCRVSSFLKTVPGCRVSRHSKELSFYKRDCSKEGHEDHVWCTVPP